MANQRKVIDKSKNSTVHWIGDKKNNVAPKKIEPKKQLEKKEIKLENINKPDIKKVVEPIVKKAIPPVVEKIISPIIKTKTVDESITKEPIIKPPIIINKTKNINKLDNHNATRILSVEKLNKFFVKSGKLVQVLEDVDFFVNEKDFFGIIGESGSGKSTTGKCMIRLYSSSSGIITFDNRIINNPVLKISQKISYMFDKLASPSDPISIAMRKNHLKSINKNYKKQSKNWLYKNMSMIFQDPMSSLNPRKNVLELVSEPLAINKTISRDIKKLFKLYEETNPYFQNTYKNQEFDLSKKYFIPFYKNNIKLFEQTILELNNLPFELNRASDLLGIISDLEFNYKNSLKELNTFVLDIKDLVYKNHKKLIRGNIHPTEIKYYETEKKLKLEKQYLKLPKEYEDLKDILNKSQVRLKEYIEKQKAVYELQNLPKFKSILNCLKSEIKSMQQDAKLTHSITDHLFKKTDIFIKKDTYNALKEVIETYGAGTNAYFDLDKMNNFCEFISNKIKSKYTDLTKDTAKLVELSTRLDTLSISEAGQEFITEILSEYKNLYNKIEDELKVLKDTDFIEEDVEVKQAINEMVESSFQIKHAITIEIEHIQKTILNIIESMNRCKNAYKRNKLETSEAYEIALKDFRIADIRRQMFVKEDNKEFRTTKLPYINEQKVIIRELDNELYNIHKKLRVIVEQKLRGFIRLLHQDPKHNVENVFKEKLSHWMKAFSDDEKSKRNAADILKRNIKNSLTSISAVNFEITNSLETIALYRKLRTKNKLKLISCAHSLKNIVTRDYVYNALDEVGLKNEHAYRYPHEFSGGQRQRIVIARALISKPKLIIADEPISALDVSIQAQVVNIMKDLAKKHNITFIFIAHDLSMVRYASNRLIIMHKGKIVEKGDTNEVFNHPIHPYTKSLIKASPELSKIHVDLASFSSKLDYDKNYSINNRPEFYSVSDEFEHYVFATKEQIKKWKK